MKKIWDVIKIILASIGTLIFIGTMLFIAYSSIKDIGMFFASLDWEMVLIILIFGGFIGFVIWSVNYIFKKIGW